MLSCARRSGSAEHGGGREAPWAHLVDAQRVQVAFDGLRIVAIRAVHQAEHVPAHVAAQVVAQPAPHELVPLLLPVHAVEDQALHRQRLCRRGARIELGCGARARLGCAGRAGGQGRGALSPPCSQNLELRRILSASFSPFLYCFSS